MKWLVIGLISLFIVGCSSSLYQLYDVKSDKLELEENYWVDDGKDLKITYGFWNKRGLMSFKIFNKSKKPIYIDWKKSSFIVNEKKFDYWQDEESKIEAGADKSYFYAKNIDEVYGKKVNFAVSKTTKPERITFIPPNSYIFKYDYLIVDDVFAINKETQCTEIDTILYDSDMSFHKCEFEKDNSLLVFRNFLTYSQDEEFESEQYVDNEFYINNIYLMEKNIFYVLNRKGDIVRSNDEMRFMKPYRFYNIK